MSRCERPIPKRAVDGWEALGMKRAADRRLEVAGAFVELWPGGPGDAERPLLNHLGRARRSPQRSGEARAEAAGAEIADVVDAPNTYAVFVWGPERVKLEYVEHKPSFSLE